MLMPVITAAANLMKSNSLMLLAATGVKMRPGIKKTGRKCFSIVLPGVTIGKGSIIGAGSVVTRDIPGGVIAAGNPAKIVSKIKVE